jgi:hypothetical protein
MKIKPERVPKSNSANCTRHLLAISGFALKVASTEAGESSRMPIREDSQRLTGRGGRRFAVVVWAEAISTGPDAARLAVIIFGRSQRER